MTPPQRRSTRVPVSRDVVDPALVIALGIGLGITLGLTIISVLPVTASAPSILYAIQALCATAGTYLILVEFLLIARLPIIERAIGQDALVVAHKTIGPWALWLITVHVALVIPALVWGRDWLTAGWALIMSDQWIYLAFISIIAFIVVGITSWALVRSRLTRGTWWTIHLYAYIAIALAFGHQILSGGPFMSGFGLIWWVGLYLLVFLALIINRVIIPIRSSIIHDFRVAAVVPETPDTASIWIKGKNLDELHARAGMFITVRFWHKGLFWEGHPYSLSAVPTDSMLRITVKALGDGSTATLGVPIGTRVLVEGPYGTMTAQRARGSRALLVAGGIGIAPMRALAEDLAPTHEVDLVVRVHDDDDLTFRSELAALATAPTVRVHRLIGPRTICPIDENSMCEYLPEPQATDVYACGPEHLLDAVRQSMAALKVRPSRIHIESFDM